MGDWPLYGGSRQEKTGLFSLNTHTPGGNAAAHTKGAWAQLVAASAFDAASILLEVGPTRVGGTFLTDLGIGGAGSEQVLVADLLSGAGFQDVCTSHLWLPLGVPAGSRLAVRGQCSILNAGPRLGVRLLSGEFLGVPPLGRCITYGADAAQTLGVAVDADPTTANTKAGWVELTASTTAAIKWLALTVTHGAGTPAATQSHLLDVGIGASGSEEVIVPDVHLITQANARLTIPQAFGLPVGIPAGTRIAVRQSSSSTNSGSGRLLYVCLHGVS